MRTYKASCGRGRGARDASLAGPGLASRRARGFTLIELLVVTSIVGMVIVVIGASMAGGVRVWDQARNFASAEIEAGIGLRVIEKDLRAIPDFTGIPFAGAALGLSFPGRQPWEGDEGVIWRLATVRYAFVAGEKRLVRKAWAYPGPEPEGAGEAVVSGITSLAVDYGGMGEDGAAGPWQPYWNDPTNRPQRVRLKLGFMTGDRTLQVERTIPLGLDPELPEDPSP